MDRKTILWLMGPKESLWNGVNQYSKLIVDEITQNESYALDITTKYINAPARSIRRYFYQFILLPIYILLFGKKFSVIVFYQEDLAFLLPFAKLLGVKTMVIYHHAPDNTIAKSLIEKIKIIYLNIIQYCIKYADKIVCPSKQSVAAIQLETGINIEKFDVIPNAFIKTVIPKSYRSNFPFFNDDNAINLLNVGSDETRKNLLTLYRSLSHVDSYRINLIRVGKSLIPENKAELDKITSENKISVYQYDFINDLDLAYLYAHSDLYVSPSIHEGFGRTVIESQIMGTSVIASQIPVYDEILNDTYFKVKNYRDEFEWARVITEACNLKNRVDEETNIKNAEKYLVENVTRLFNRCLLEMFKK